MQKVEFESCGVHMVGNLFVPRAFTNAERRPGIVVTGSWTTVKEQMPDTYARRLADAGFVALSFDFRGLGESGGSPRDLESRRVGRTVAS